VGGTLPPNAVVGGRTILGDPFYIGRAGHNENLLVGGMSSALKCTMLAYNGTTIVNNTNFEVLVKTQLGVTLDLSI
jgi:hypothetical protein